METSCTLNPDNLFTQTYKFQDRLKIIKKQELKFAPKNNIWPEYFL